MSSIKRNGVTYGTTQANEITTQVNGVPANLQILISNILGSFATIETSNSNVSQSYSAGDYLIYNGRLYKVIASIAQGAALELNTNVQETTVKDEFNLLNQNLATAVTNITANGTTLTMEKMSGSTSTITTQDTTYGIASTSTNGLMSSTDKTKINRIPNATSTSFPVADLSYTVISTF